MDPQVALVTERSSLRAAICDSSHDVAVIHAYSDDAVGAVRVFADLEPAALLIVISDDAHGMTPRTDSTGIGVGLVVIGRVATSLQIDDDSTGTRLTMRFERRA